MPLIHLNSFQFALVSFHRENLLIEHTKWTALETANEIRHHFLRFLRRFTSKFTHSLIQFNSVIANGRHQRAACPRARTRPPS